MKSLLNNVRRARPLLGTFVEIEVVGLSEVASHRAVEAGFAAVEEVQRRMSFHDPDSVLSRLNRQAAQQAIQVDEWTFEVLEAAAAVYRISGGVFDVTVAPRLQRLGFLPGERTVVLPQGCEYSFADVELLPDRYVRFHHPGILIDLGGIAKGFAVDQAVAALISASAPGGLVNAGGDLRAFGSEAFPVSIRHPDDPGAVFATVPLSNRSLASSAHYFANRVVADSTLGPIIDPQSGEQSVKARSVSVQAASAMFADALTKVVMLSGKNALPALERFDADALFIDASGKATFSPHWNEPFVFSS